jgi:membrane protease YdiL (CAAX protease family)
MRSYLDLTRSQTYSLLFAVPLLLLYEAGALYLGRTGEFHFRNGADVLLRTLLLPIGIRGSLAVTALLLVVAAVVIALERRRRRIRLRTAPFLGMALESTVYAMLLGVVVGTMTQWVLGGIPLLAAGGGPLDFLPLREGIVLSLGAGIYEEIVFRVLLVGGIFGVFRASGLDRGRAGAFSALLAALLFSAFHYVGPYGDPWAVASFLFRFLAGLAFSVLFLLRGLGITAWTHALYDVFLLITRQP